MADERRGFLVRLGRLAGIVSLGGVARAVDSGGDADRREVLSDALVGPQWATEKPEDCTMSWTCNVHCNCYGGNYSAVPGPTPVG